MFLLKTSFDPSISLYLWHKRLQERGAAGTPSPLQSHSLQRNGKGQMSWGRPELLRPRAVTLGWGHTTATTLHPLTPAQCFAFDTWQRQAWSSSPPLVLLEGKQPLAFQPCWQIKPLACYLSKTLMGLICTSAREVGGNHSHRHWSISCPWHLCGLLVQLRQQLQNIQCSLKKRESTQQFSLWPVQ